MEKDKGSVGSRYPVEGGASSKSTFRGRGAPARTLEPICPWCSVFIFAEEDQARVHGVRYHAGCAEDLLTRDTEIEA